MAEDLMSLNDALGKMRDSVRAGDGAEMGPTLLSRLVAHIDAQAAEITRMDGALRTVERWANHHACKPSTTPAEALGVIQHHPVIRKITAGYSDGVAPPTRNPYEEIERMKTALESIARHMSSEWTARCIENVMTARKALGVSDD
jgi:hypothetical protein